jgi:phosphatidate cytidylyltransferase
LLRYPLAAAVGALIALLATVGDLIESRFKRACGVKDSSTFMPAGMGGFLDMFDSILFIPALAYLPVFYFCAHT